MKRWSVCTVLCALSIPAVIAQRPKAADLLDRNLVRNAGGEQVEEDGVFVETWWDADEHKGEKQQLAVMVYGAAPGRFEKGWGRSSGHGDRYFEFTCGSRATISSKIQIIEVAALKDSIDAGRLTATLAASTAAIANEHFHGALHAIFMDASSHVLGKLSTPEMSGVVTGTAWHYDRPEASMNVPERTRTVRVYMEVHCDSDEDFAGAFAMDDLSLVLSPRP